MKKRVVITGLGCFTPVGNSVSTTWNNLVNGVSGVDYLTQFDASTFPSKIGGEVKQFDPNAFISDEQLLKYTSRIHQLGIAAAIMAVENARLIITKIDSSRIGVSLGATGQYPDLKQLSYFYRFKNEKEWDHKTFGKHADISPTWVFQRAMHTVSSVIAKLFKVSGPNVTIHTACASSSHSIGQAFRIIERGDADVMITGGTDAIASPLWVSGFILLGALSTQNIEPQKASRPFDKKRDGFVIAEGSVMLILEELGFALQRGAKIYAEIVGFGSSSNAFRITDLPQDGAGPLLSNEKGYR